MSSSDDDSSIESDNDSSSDTESKEDCDEDEELQPLNLGISGGPKRIPGFPADLGAAIGMVFEKLFDPTLMEHIVSLSDKRVNDPREYDPEFNIKEFKIEHLKLWIAIEILMGLCPQPTLEHYWMLDDGMFGSPWIQDRVSRNTFRSISAAITFEPLFLIQNLRGNCQEAWNPAEYVAIDEMIIPFQGRSAHRIHIRGKPWADGLKLFGMADELQYLFSFFLYQGSHSERPTSVKQLVLDFSAELPADTAHMLVVDSYYGSQELADELHESGRRFILACSKNRPSSLFSKHLHLKLHRARKGDYAKKWVGQYLAVSIKDNSVVNLLTNCAGTSTVESKSKRHKNRKPQDITQVLQAYRERLGRVDNVDATLTRYIYQHRGSKWTLALLRGLISIACHNSWIIVKHLSGQDFPFSEFLTKLVQHLAGDLCIREKPSRNMKAQKKARSAKHSVTTSPTTGSCAHCKGKKKPPSSMRTYLKCDDCGVHLHKRCSAPYHQNVSN